METDTLSKWYQKKAGTAALTSDKINFKLKMVKRDKEEHYIMIKESINPSRKYENYKHLYI